MTAGITTVRDGAIDLPAELRERFRLADGSVPLIDAANDEIRLRPAESAEIEIYTPERIAEFLLNNVVDDADYRGAVEEVRKLGLDPETIPHHRPDS